MERIFVKPNPGRTVPDPATRRNLPEEGGWIRMSGYWQRRLRDEDVSPAMPPMTGAEE